MRGHSGVNHTQDQQFAVLTDDAFVAAHRDKWLR